MTEIECIDGCMYGNIGYAVCDDDCKCKCNHTKWSEIFGKSKQ
jgi:hypothetical protein